LRLLSSPRFRRRLSYVGVVLLAAGIVALVIELIPSTTGGPEHFSPGAVQKVTTPRQVPLTPADRRAIDTVLDLFVPAAIGRRHPLRAWPVSSPRLRAGVTRREWAHGGVPVVPYPAGGRRFHDWVLQYSFPKLVGIELGLRPRRGAKVGAAAFEVELERVHRRWLVNAIYLRAIYPP
jgi:hypothetical protein